MKLTRNNLEVLKELFAKGDEAPNKLDATDVPHLRRCVKLGLMDIDGQVLRLTAEGKAAIAGGK